MAEAIECGVRVSPYMLHNEGFLLQLASLADDQGLL
jgi:hypothetical protein